MSVEMTDLEARLDRALKAGDPAPRDPMFRIEVLLRRERAVLRRRLARTAVALAAAVALAFIGLAVVDGLVGPGPVRQALIVAGAVILTAVLAATGAEAPPRALARHWLASVSWTLRTMSPRRGRT
jgi:hypothetical protein